MKRAAWVVADFALLFLVLLSVAALAMKGYCFEQRRFVPWQEVEQVAIRYELATFPPSVPLRLERLGEGRSVETWGVPRNAQRYGGVSAFLSENPGGCQRVVQGAEGDTSSVLSRLFGIESTSCDSDMTSNFANTATCG